MPVWNRFSAFTCSPRCGALDRLLQPLRLAEALPAACLQELFERSPFDRRGFGVIRRIGQDDQSGAVPAADVYHGYRCLQAENFLSMRENRIARTVKRRRIGAGRMRAAIAIARWPAVSDTAP
jgi:hypothetical protein